MREKGYSVEFHRTNGSWIEKRCPTAIAVIATDWGGEVRGETLRDNPLTGKKGGKADPYVVEVVVVEAAAVVYDYEAVDEADDSDAVPGGARELEADPAAYLPFFSLKQLAHDIGFVYSELHDHFGLLPEEEVRYIHNLVLYGNFTLSPLTLSKYEI